MDRAPATRQLRTWGRLPLRNVESASTGARENEARFAIIPITAGKPMLSRLKLLISNIAWHIHQHQKCPSMVKSLASTAKGRSQGTFLIRLRHSLHCLPHSAHLRVSREAGVACSPAGCRKPHATGRNWLLSLSQPEQACAMRGTALRRSSRCVSLSRRRRRFRKCGRFRPGSPGALRATFPVSPSSPKAFRWSGSQAMLSRLSSLVAKGDVRKMFIGSSTRGSATSIH